jgi:5'-nucleotidase
MERPLILVTNDDGITSAGLWAAVEAVLPLGEVLVVAPDRQWSGAGRAMPHEVTGKLIEHHREIAGKTICAYAADASPAQAVGHAVLELAPRTPDLVVSGVNFGPNLGIEVTISGTVGAALEAAAFGIPAVAVSLEMDPAYYLEGDTEADYAASQANVYKFARLLLANRPPRGVDVINVNIPSDATPDTFWRLTRLSRHRYFVPLPPDRARGEGRAGYKLLENPAATEIDSDILTMAVARLVSVTPLSLDMTARVNFPSLNTLLLSEMAAATDLSRLSALFEEYPMFQ